MGLAKLEGFDLTTGNGTKEQQTIFQNAVASIVAKLAQSPREKLTPFEKRLLHFEEKRIIAGDSINSAVIRNCELEFE